MSRAGFRIWIVLLSAIFVVVLILSSPWWYTWLLWRDSNISWIQTGPGVDPVSFHITNSTAAGPNRIPKIIHQTWKDELVPPEWLEAQAACKALHPEYEYRLWTDASAREFIISKFPHLLETWDSYPYGIQRADAIRYAVLQEFGGYYIDLDIVCVRPLDFLGRYPVVLPKTWPVGFSNDFLAAEKGSPLMRALVAALPRWNVNLLFKYPTVMFSTGPMLVTLQASFFKDRSSLWVVRDTMYNKYVQGGVPLFSHLYGSSWHGEDAKSILWILHHPVFLIAVGGTTLLGLAVWRHLQNGREWSRRSILKASEDPEDEQIVHSPLTEITIVKRARAKLSE